LSPRKLLVRHTCQNHIVQTEVCNLTIRSETWKTKPPVPQARPGRSIDALFKLAVTLLVVGRLAIYCKGSSALSSPATIR
jgi:hypothetical protein